MQNVCAKMFYGSVQIPRGLCILQVSLGKSVGTRTGQNVNVNAISEADFLSVSLGGSGN